MNVSDLTQEQLTNEIIDKILFDGLKYNETKADCILVLGSRSAIKYRLPKAIQLFNNNKRTKLLFTGGREIENEGVFISEAALMKSKAIELGVNKEAILIDEQSFNTKENMICSQLVLERAFKLSKVNKIVLVTTTYHMRRSMMMASKYLPNWIDIIPCPADDSNTKRSNWYTNDAGYNRAFNEVVKIISYIREGSITDFSI